MATITDDLLYGYGTDPWAGLNRNILPWYSPVLIDVFRTKAVYGQFVPTQVKISETNEMYWDQMFDLEPNVNSIDMRALWLTAMKSDSQRIGIKTRHYAGKVALNKYDAYISRWKKNGQAGLEAIIRDLLGQSIVDTLDILARNAFMQLHFSTNALGLRSTWNDLTDQDLYDWEWGTEARLQAQTLNLPGFDPDLSGSIMAITTPGALYAMEKDQTSRELWKYTNPMMAFNHEQGGINHVRYVSTPRNILWNCGAITKQVGITAAITAGQGGYNWGPYVVGQANATNHIHVENFAAGDFKVNDIVTIHTSRASAGGVVTVSDVSNGTTSEFTTGVANGVNPFDGMTFTRIVKYVKESAAGAAELGFDRPLFWDYSTDLGGGIYGYVTKGRHVHATVYLFNPGAVVSAVTQPIEAHNPPVVDDVEGLHRFSWDGFLSYSPFRPEFAEVVFHSGQHRLGGTASTGA